MATPPERPISARVAALAPVLSAIALMACLVGAGGAVHGRAWATADLVRVGALGLALLACLAWAGRQGRARRRAGVEAVAEVAEVAALRRRRDDALAMLRRLRPQGSFGLRRRRLPWYLVIGAPGSGKTAALTNAGLRFPFPGRARDGVADDAQHCTWRLADEAVLLDTPGRYTAHDDARGRGAAGWAGLLALLGRRRRRQPLAGVIVTLSLSDLAEQAADADADAARAAEGLARVVRARVQEACAALGARLPIYLLVTRCDELAGFSEFFGDLGGEARAQVWGITFGWPAAPGAAPGAALGAEFSALVARLNARVGHRLEDEREVRRRAAIFAFPRRFAAVGRPLVAFVDQAFGASAFDRDPLLRGVYFTSAPPSGRSHFLARLLREVIFAEAGIGAGDGARGRRRRLRAFVLLAAFGVLSGLLAVAWTAQVAADRARMRALATAAASLADRVAVLPPASAGDVLAVLPVLDAAGAMPTARVEAPLPWFPDPGQAQPLELQARATYLRLLREALLPRIALRLEQQLREADTLESRYQTLRTYLALHDPAHVDARAIADRIAADWDRTLPAAATAGQRAVLQAHLATALAQRPLRLPLSRDQALVAAVRGQLAASSLAERVYARLKRQGLARVPDFRVSEAAGPQAALVFVRASGRPLSDGIPGLFTAAGDARVFRVLAPLLARQLGNEQGWVLGGPEPFDAAALRATLDGVRRLYLAEYLETWDRLLGDLRLRPYDSLQGSIQAITLLAAGDSPLRLLLAAVARETQLAPDAAPTAPEAIVDAHFEPVRRAVSASAGQAAPLDATLGVLREYEVHLRATDEAGKRGLSAPEDAWVLARLRSEADRMPVPVGGLLAGLVARSDAQSAGAAQAATLAALASEVGAACRQAVAGRYPFVRGSAQEVALADFARLFAPGGVIDGFARDRLAGRVDTSGPAWRTRVAAAGVEPLPAAIRADFGRAAAIREAFFAPGSASPAAALDLVLRHLDEGVSEVRLSVDGQVSSMRPDATAGVHLSWPGTAVAGRIELTLLADGRPLANPLVFDGPWALFRLVDAGRPAGGPPERWLVSYEHGGGRAVFELRAASVRDPLRLPELAQFRCPG